METKDYRITSAALVLKIEPISRNNYEHEDKYDNELSLGEVTCKNKKAGARGKNQYSNGANSKIHCQEGLLCSINRSMGTVAYM